MSKLKEVNEQNFEAEVLKSDKPVLVDFSAEWCVSCKALNPKLESLSLEDSSIKVLKIDVDENINIATKYGVRGIPLMIFFKNGQNVGELVGNQPIDSIKEYIEHIKSKT